MASTFQYLLLLLLFIIAPSSSAKSSFRPKALVIPVTRDDSALLYVTQIHQRTPLVPVKLVLDVGGQFVWVDCKQNYTSSTYRPARCNSTQCHLAGADICSECFTSPRPGCHNTCILSPENPLNGVATTGDVGQDVVSVRSTNGFNQGRKVAVSSFIFSCAPTSLLSNNLADGVSGVAALGRTKVAFPSQFASAFNFPRKFAICLASRKSKGVVFFGDRPYVFRPNVNAAESLTYTPLIHNRPTSGFDFEKRQASSEYFIGVESIKVDQKVVQIRKKLLSINKKGLGGTKISTLHPYTVLEKSIYKAVTKAFLKEMAARNITRVTDVVSRFDYCFSTKNIGSTRLGAAVPTIEFVLQNNVTWPVFGANSMEPTWTDDNVLCLAVENGGDSPKASIVIGGHQMENHLLQFDLDSSRLGFSPLLFGKRTTCANFNFKSAA
ncbi:basic 7S globulin-like [Neltuma alba]|uniref:basic 7S globulin-like n=1 Tax=Neltuma alba TaxID=207710 RepID=UPI0010A4C009|nr:basic 7S globulin-like [Prosopis alba]